MKIDVVIAFYRENGVERWANAFGKHENSEAIRVFVYHKGDRCAARDLLDDGRCILEKDVPNVGREAETWLRYVVERYEKDDFPDCVVFLQGYPFDHFSHEYRKMAFTEIVSNICSNAQTVVKTTPLLCAARLEKTPPHFPNGRVNVRQAWTDVFGPSTPHPAVYEFAAGAQYIVPVASCIRCRPGSWWRELHEKVKADKVNAWEIERLWMYIFASEPGGQMASMGPKDPETGGPKTLNRGPKDPEPGAQMVRAWIPLLISHNMESLDKDSLHAIIDQAGDHELWSSIWRTNNTALVDSMLELCIDCGRCALMYREYLTDLCAMCHGPELVCSLLARNRCAAQKAVRVKFGEEGEVLQPLLFHCSARFMEAIIDVDVAVDGQLTSSRDEDGLTPLMFFCLDSNKECVELLLRHIPEEQVLLRSDDGTTALMYACDPGDTELVELLLKYKPVDQVLSRSNDDGMTALMHVCACDEYDPEHHPALVELLLRYKPEEQVSLHGGPDGKTALMYACRNLEGSCYDMADVLLRYAPGEQVRARDARGRTALMHACDVQCALQLVKLLLRTDPESQVLARDDEGMTALMRVCAADDCFVDMALVEVLLQFEPEEQVVVRNADGFNALMYAVQNSHNSSIVSSLLLHKPRDQVLAADEESGMTVLVTAIKRSNSVLVELLMRHAPWEQVRAARSHGWIVRWSRRSRKWTAERRP